MLSLLLLLVQVGLEVLLVLLLQAEKSPQQWRGQTAAVGAEAYSSGEFQQQQRERA